MSMTQKLVIQQGNAVIPLKESTIIAHIVNNLGKWGKGFVLPLGKEYPLAKKSFMSWANGQTTIPYTLGQVQFVEVDSVKKIFVANMLSQDGILTRSNQATRSQFVSYEALESCLTSLKDFALKEGLSVQMPMIGAGLGGGNWEHIVSLIEKHLTKHNIPCTVLQLA